MTSTLPTEIRIFIASSSELSDDRAAFAEMVRRRNNEWVGRGVHLKLEMWEDFLDAMSKTRLQDEYNRVIEQCDVFVMLYFTKVGKYTEEEFNTAFKKFKATSRPFIYTYFKNSPVDLDAIDPADLASRKAFQARLKALNHFQTAYPNVEGLQFHFWQQLDKMVANGFIRFPSESDAGTGASYQATLTGDGAIAQDNSQAVGARGMMLNGPVTGIVNTGIMTTNSPRPRRPKRTP